MTKQVTEIKFHHPSFGSGKTNSSVEVPVGDPYGLFTKENMGKIRDIKIKMEWKKETFAERNFYTIYMKRLKKYEINKPAGNNPGK